MSEVENPAAFPLYAVREHHNGFHYSFDQAGMSLRDYFAGQALAVTESSYSEWQLKAWFGGRTGLTAAEIRSRAAYAIADAMLAARSLHRAEGEGDHG